MSLATDIRARIDAFVAREGLDARTAEAIFTLWHDELYPLDHAFELDHVKRHLDDRIATLPDGEDKTRLTLLRAEYEDLEKIDPGTIVDRLDTTTRTR